MTGKGNCILVGGKRVLGNVNKNSTNVGPVNGVVAGETRVVAPFEGNNISGYDINGV